jgi:hypothetical protein
MAKIVCAMCRNEINKFCKVKKIGIHLNKRRDCDKFILEPSKVKEKQILQTIKVSYAEREEAKRGIKAALKHAKEQLKNNQSVIEQHPLTGDLSRFVSTATKE